MEFWWEPFLTVALVLVLASILVVERRRWAAATATVPSYIRRGVVGFAVAAFLFRQFAVAPAFLHDDYIGPAIVATALSFPPDPSGPWRYGKEYGLAGFTVLSLAATAFGHNVETIFAANNVSSALTALPLAVVTAFWVESPAAGLYAAAIWTTAPLVARIAHSEDIHTIGMLWALCGIALLEIALSLGSGLTLLGAVIALELAALTRQTFYPWLVIAAAIFTERWLRARRSGHVLPRGFGSLSLAALGLACVPIALRMHYSIDTWESQDTVTVYRTVLGAPEILWDTLVHHPIVALREVSFTVPVLGLVGLFVIGHRSRSPLAILLAVAGWFIVGFPTYPNRGSDWPFRFPFYVLAIIAAGAGAAWVMDRVARRVGRPLSGRVQLGAAAVLAVLGMCSSATLENRRPDPEFVEYVFVREALKHLDTPFSVVANGGTGVPSRTPDLLAFQFGLPVINTADSPNSLHGPRPFVFLVGLGCHAHGLPELLGLEQTPPGVRPSEDTMARFHRLARDRSMHFGLDVGPPPTRMRAPCEKILEHATTLVEGPEVELEDVPPWSFFDVHRLRLRLVRWDPPPSS